MKTLFIALIAVFAPLAQAGTLEIVNKSSLRADIGVWKGTWVPSICEDFKPCWVEVNPKFIPAPGLGDIRGPKEVEIAEGATINLYVPGLLGTYNIVGDCRSVNSDDLSFYFQVGGEARLRDANFLTLCLASDRARLVID